MQPTSSLKYIYLAIPFLVEIKSFIEWIFKDTNLTLTQWLHFHNLYLHIAPLAKNESSTAKLSIYQVLRWIFLFIGLCLFALVVSGPIFFLSDYGLWAASQYDVTANASISLEIGKNNFPIFDLNEKFFTENLRLDKLQDHKGHIPKIDSSHIQV